MTGLDLLRYLTQAPFLVIFIVVCVEALRRPYRVNIDIATFFGMLLILFVIGWTLELFDLVPPRWLVVLLQWLLLALPYVLLRLVHDFALVRPLFMRVAEVGLLASLISLLFVEPPYDRWYAEALVTYWLGVQLYVTYRFAMSARESRGVTLRRMQAVAIGSGLFAVVLAIVGIRTIFNSGPDTGWTVASHLFTLASGLAFLVGFAPPRILRTGWQAAEFRPFLRNVVAFSHLPDELDLIRNIEEGSAASLGASGAALLLWDEETQELVWPSGVDFGVLGVSTSFRDTLPWDVFHTQRGDLIGDAARDDPKHANRFRAFGATAIVAAPVTDRERRLGVLAIYSPRASLFAGDDVALAELLATQAAALILNHRLIHEAAEMRGREEATRLKEDFLSAAAHDLKTPLTTILGHAQLLERRATRQPEQSPAMESIRRLASEAARMRSLVNDLLDASRWESGGFVGERVPADLGELAREVAALIDAPRHEIRVEAPDPVVVDLDVARMRQVLQNLLENAVKYSPDSGDVIVRVQADGDGDEAQLSVSDQGVGIPEGSLPAIFERFNRGGLTTDRTFGGMGLGLFLSKRIVEGHGGRIWAESTLGTGSTFHVALPLRVEAGPVVALPRAEETTDRPEKLPDRSAPLIDLRATPSGEAGDG